MTETTTGPALAEFNGGVLFSLLAERGKLLDANMLDGYKPGFERELADELIYGLTAAQRAEALEILLQISMYVYASLGAYLDECETGSYKACDEMSAILLAEIRAQKAEPRALRSLVTDEICNERKSIVFMRDSE